MNLDNVVAVRLMVYCLVAPLPIESTAMFSKSLQITVELGAREGTRILYLNGPLDMETTLEFQRVVRAETSPVLIVDFGGVPYMDSAGIRRDSWCIRERSKGAAPHCANQDERAAASVGRAESSQQDPCNVHQHCRSGNSAPLKGNQRSCGASIPVIQFLQIPSERVFQQPQDFLTSIRS